MPVTMTHDGKNFVWRVFDSGLGGPRVLYRGAGTVAELFETLNETGGIWKFAIAEGVIALDAELGISEGMLRVLDMVTADTRLKDVAGTIRR